MAPLEKLCFIGFFDGVFIVFFIISKVSYFFPEKVGGSINQSNPKILCFFFSAKRKKKYKGVFFFPEKVHEAFIQDLVGFSLFFLKVGCVFFFHIFGCFLCIFFSCKSSHAIHSFDLEAVFFFSSRKKKQLFYSFNRFCPKMWKKWTFTGKKIRYLWVAPRKVLHENSPLGDKMCMLS